MPSDQPDTGLTPMLVGMVKADGKARQKALTMIPAIARKHGLSEDVVRFYLSFGG